MNFADWFMFTSIGTVIGIGVMFGSFVAYYHFRPYNKPTFSWIDVSIMTGIAFIIAAIVSASFLYGNQASKTSDTEIWNGQIVGKSKDRVSCEHSYQCNCVESCSGSGSSHSCLTTCQTCYDHSYDIDWNLKTDIGSDIKVDRINRQGTKEPPRYTVAKVGEPVAIAHTFTNWVKGSDQTLMRSDNQSFINRYLDFIPAYPDGVYDYHRLNRVLAQQVALPDIIKWNDELSVLLKTLGPLKQANVVIVFVKSADPQVANAINAAWLGGKKNDILIIVGTSTYPKIDFVDVNAWTDNEMFKVKLRDELFALSNIDRTLFLGIVYNNVRKGYTRKPMADYAYLESDIAIETSTIIWMFLAQILLSAGLGFFIARDGSILVTFSSSSRFSRFNRRF